MTQRREKMRLRSSEQSLEELEGKHSDLRRELVAAREALSRSGLEKEVLEEDKASLALALTKVRTPRLCPYPRFDHNDIS